jgi:hypothetical protein
MMKKASDIINKIKTEDIRQIPRWRFSLKNFAAWGGFGISVLIGAVAFSVILFAIQQSDFSVVSHLDHSGLEMILALMPIVWLGCIILFLLLAVWSIRNSWKGYKFSLFKQVSISVLLSMAIGTLFFITGGGEKLEAAFNANVFSYESINERKQKIWSNPDEGYLSGTITSVKEEMVEIKDFKGKIWSISIEGSFIAPVVMLENDEVIKLIGEKTGESTFKSVEIRPWGGMQGQGGMGRRNNK